MAAINGYFQILLGDNVSFVRLFPPEGDGESIVVDELRDYLLAKGFQIDIVEVKKVIDGLTKPTDYKIADKRGIPCAESFSVKISPDKMTVTCRFYPCSTAGSALTREAIISELNFRGVRKGIDEAAIGQYLGNKLYCTDYVLAKGLQPTLGSDAAIEYFFNTNPNAKPKLNDDGTVDFFNLSTISKCEKGQVLATLTKEERGEPGYNVVGDILQPREVKKLSLKYNRNAELSEDKLSIIASVSGHVSLVDDKVFVSDVYECVDVDTSTGNIDYDGSVAVSGNVKAGFVIQATGDVIVHGVVEGAMIESGGNVIIDRGMNGMGKGIINAKGNVVSKFLENTTIVAEGYVHAEAILHSKIQAKGDVEVTGKKGFITGGSIRSLGCVSAKTIGSDMGVDTEVEVGVDPTVKNRFEYVNSELAKARKKVEQVEPVLLTLTKKIKSGAQLTIDQTRYFKQLSVEYQEARGTLSQYEQEYMQLQDEMDAHPTESVIKVSEFAYPGTKLSISDVSTTLTKPVQHSRFVKEGADIRIKAL